MLLIQNAHIKTMAGADIPNGCLLIEDGKIAAVGTERFGGNYAVSDNAENPDAIMVRSAKLHDMEFGSDLLAIARAGAGVNNIPVDRCAEEGIVVFNTPGANSNAVKELAICALLLSSRKITEAAAWAASLKGTPDAPKTVEGGKSKFAGPEIMGKTLGIIGLGFFLLITACSSVRRNRFVLRLLQISGGLVFVRCRT